ncbi:ABC transporter permease subunit [Marivivens sp. LCG002]|uniref:ABC transporter permease subunit n=1 Tax=Marivivens sp. LCG002 TaxID=3051171 RepID=UPI0025521073|nr:ABC transporter permease subunit [Marivivens sp. LCG002]WIV50345.1 ABC transporter permease subunit [Marivivens sp. LCG002]
MFSRTTADQLAGVANAQAIKGRSLWHDAFRRFVRNRAALISLVLLGFVLVFAFFGQYLSPHEPDFVDFSLRRDIKNLGAPSIENAHFFGLEQEGRDLYTRVVQGTRISILVGVIGSLVAVVVGTLYGAFAGYMGGRIDSVMMRIVDILIAIPFMFVIILLLVVFGRSMVMLFVGVGLISWLDMARIARGQTLTIKNKEFVEAAVATGVKPFTVILRHIVPNLAGIVIVYATLLIPQLIITESFISFLGLGIQEPMTSLGALISAGASQLGFGTPWMIGFPLFFFLITLYAFFFVGDGLRDALDPKDR